MHIGTFESFEVAYRAIFRNILGSPDAFESAPRGKPIRELIGASFTLTDPRNRLILSPTRQVNYGFGVGELCWYLRGAQDLETLLYYNRRAGQFSDDGRTVNSSYGHRLFNPKFDLPARPKTSRDSGPPLPPDSISQIDMLLMELRSDPDSRRAVMHINVPHDLFQAVTVGSKDVPCTLSIQLFIRERRLHMHVVMRSNDANWGTPYDVFSFTCMQELFVQMLQREGVPVDGLGSYHHTAGSLHLYEPFYRMAEDVCREEGEGPPPMEPLLLGEVEDLVDVVEPGIRRNTYDRSWKGLKSPSGGAKWMFEQLVKHRQKRDSEATKGQETE